MKARVYKSTGNWYTLRTENGHWVQARLKGSMRLQDLKSSNPIAVGDYVQMENEQGDWMITHIEQRNNYIIRQSPAKKTHAHIIASNIDLACVIVTLSKPRTSTGFIDRFLVTAEAYHIPSVLVFNKQDALNREDERLQTELITMYSNIGYPCYKVSSINQTGFKEIKQLFKNQTVLLIGHSGVGKSTFANALDEALSLKTGEISEKHEKGMHTTTFAEMFPLSFGGELIDIPGIKEFGVLNFEPEELSHYFKEMMPLINHCKYNNCMHINEPKCAVKEALVKEEISEERYKNYLNILDDIEEAKPY